MKIQLAVKFQKYLMDDYNAIVQTDEQTDGTDNYSPFLTKVGGLIYKQVPYGDSDLDSNP